MPDGGGVGGTGERGKPRREVPASPERRASRANPTLLREAGWKGSQGTQAGGCDTEAKVDPIRWFYGVFWFWEGGGVSLLPRDRMVCRLDENQSPKWKWLVNPRGKFLNILERLHAKK